VEKASGRKDDDFFVWSGNWPRKGGLSRRNSDRRDATPRLRRTTAQYTPAVFEALSPLLGGNLEPTGCDSKTSVVN